MFELPKTVIFLLPKIIAIKSKTYSNFNLRIIFCCNVT